MHIIVSFLNWGNGSMKIVSFVLLISSASFASEWKDSFGYAECYSVDQQYADKWALSTCEIDQQEDTRRCVTDKKGRVERLDRCSIYWSGITICGPDYLWTAKARATFYCRY